MPEPGSVEQAHSILRSFLETVGRPLLDVAGLSDEEAAVRLFQAPMVVVSHDTAVDPRLNYANETSMGDRSSLPSRDVLTLHGRTHGTGGA